MYRIGLDVGSTTIKCIVLDDRDQIIYKNYVRHRAMVREIALTFIEDIRALIPEEEVHMAVTGSAGIGLAENYELPFIQEVMATQIHVEEDFSHIDVVIELGGEDAKILFLTNGMEVRMNGSCAGGTGAFIDQMNVLLDMNSQEFDEISLKAEHIHPIASRCGVFAKTDVQPLLNQGARKEDVAMSIYHAVVNQTIGGLAQGRRIEGNIMFLGGPLTFLKGLQKAFRDLLNQNDEQYFFPENGQYFVAYGAAMHSVEERKVNLEFLEASLKSPVAIERTDHNIAPLFDSQDEYDTFSKRHASHTVERGDFVSYDQPVFLGVDAGSTTIKLVLTGQNGELLYEMYQASNGRPVEAVQESLTDIYAQKPDIQIQASAVTGYGEALVKEAFNMDFGLVETMAHLTAAQAFEPEVDFIIDIGGQDMKCFRIRNGAIDTIFLNEACSSGCGSFIQTFATALGYDVEEFGNLGLFAKYPVDLGSRCTVFMNSSVKQAQKEGAGVDDISAGLSVSVVKNALYKVIRVNSIEELGKHIVVQGGTFYNDAILRAFEKEVGGEVMRPEIAGLMGAYGCGLYASRQGLESSGIIGPEELENFTHTTETKNCKLCGNYCQLTINHFSHGEDLIAGNRCERPVKHARDDSHEPLPNIYAYKRERIAALCKVPEIENARGTVAIPLGLNIYEMYPFWFAFWRSLKYNVIFSPFSSKDIYLEGQHSVPSDTVCYPAKIMHGHILRLIEKEPDFIFYPCLTYNFDENISDNHYNCPVVAYYPQVLEANMEELKHIPYHMPFYGVHNRRHFTRQVTKDMKKFAGLPTREVRKAVDAAYAAQEEYHADILDFGRQAVTFARERSIPIVVLAGRPYHIDPEINHGIDTLISSYHVVVISEDSLPLRYDDTSTKVLNQWTYHARLYNAAKIVGESEDMAFIQLVSFGCGLDAITTDEAMELLEERGDIYTQIKIDEINNLGAVRIRLRSLFATAEEKKRREALEESI